MMKATYKHIQHLSGQIHLFIDRLSQSDYERLKKEYESNPVRTMWALYWKCYDMEPELWRNETKDWKDTHIETMIKRAIKETILN